MKIFQQKTSEFTGQDLVKAEELRVIHSDGKKSDLTFWGRCEWGILSEMATCRLEDNVVIVTGLSTMNARMTKKFVGFIINYIKEIHPEVTQLRVRFNIFFNTEKRKREKSILYRGMGFELYRNSYDYIEFRYMFKED